jgi:phosphoribosylformylglycinamidine synthase
MRLIKSAHDISEGGVLSAVAECCIINAENQMGAKVNIPVKSRDDFSFFSESQSRIVVSIEEKSKKDFENLLNKKEQYYILIGRTGGNSLRVNEKLEIDVDKLADIYFNTISRIMNA